MSVVMMSGNGQQWLHLGQRESAILDAMLAWARAMAKTNPERIQIMEDGEKYIRSGGEHPRTFTVYRFDEGLALQLYSVLIFAQRYPRKLSTGRSRSLSTTRPARWRRWSCRRSAPWN